MSGKTKKDAALSAGFSLAMAENASAKIESKDVQRAFQLLARKAVPAERIIRRLSQGLDATARGKKAPDYRERREHLVLAAKFGGYYVDKSELGVEGEIDVRDPEQRAARIAQLLESARARSASPSNGTGAV